MQKQSVKGENRSTWRRNGKRIYGTHVQVGLVQPGLIDAFALHLRLSGKAEQTVEAYCRHLEMFARSIRIPLSQANEKILRTYISCLKDRGYSVYTVDLKARSLKRFYGFLADTGRILMDPARNIITKIPERRLPGRILKTAAMEEIRKTIPGNTVTGCRDRAIVEVLYSTAIRISELAALDVSDIDLESGVVKVRKGKGGRERTAVLNPAAIRAVSEYLKIRPELKPSCRGLWISRLSGSKICSQTISLALKKYAASAGVKEPVNPHAWRHGVATELLRRGASVREIQAFLGHTRLSTTQIYTHVTMLDLKKVHRTTHPREQDPDPDFAAPVLPINCRSKTCTFRCDACRRHPGGFV